MTNYSKNDSQYWSDISAGNDVSLPMIIEVSQPRLPLAKQSIEVLFSYDRPFGAAVLNLDLHFHLLKKDRFPIEDFLTITYSFENFLVSKHSLPIKISDISES